MNGCETQLSLPAILVDVGFRCSTQPTTGSTICKSDFGSPQCLAQPFDTSKNLAFQGATAQAAVTFDSLPGFGNIHNPRMSYDRGIRLANKLYVSTDY